MSTDSPGTGPDANIQHHPITVADDGPITITVEIFDGDGNLVERHVSEATAENTLTEAEHLDAIRLIDQGFTAYDAVRIAKIYGPHMAEMQAATQSRQL